MYYTMPIKDYKDHCDKLLDIFYKCNTTDNSYIKSKCHDIEKLINTTWITAYINCKKWLKENK